MSSKERTARWRASWSKEELEKNRAKDNERKAKKLATMTQEQRDEMREKDRLRQAAKRAKERSKSEPTPKQYNDNTREVNRRCQEKKRANQSEAEKEYERIENLLIKRRSRSARTKEEVESENLKAKEGMRYERLIPFKGRRRYKCREEFHWWQYWKIGAENKDILRKKLPEYAERFTEWDSKKENPYAEVENVDGDVDIDDGKMRTDEQMKQLRKEKLQQRRTRIREQLNQPIELPEIEKSEYELLRDQNIAERERMMKEAEEAGMFDPK